MTPVKKNMSENTALEYVKPLIDEAYRLMHTDPVKCIELSEKALNYSIENNFTVGIGMSYLHIGLGYFHQSDFYAAHKNYILAEPYFKEENFWYGLRVTYNNLGLVYKNWNNYEKALFYYQKNLALEDRLSDPKLTSTILNNIGTIYMDSKNYEKALPYIIESLDTADKIEYFYMSSVASSNLGKIYIELNDHKNAEHYLRNSISIKEKITDYNGMCSVYIHLSSLYEGLENYEKALDLLHTALRFGQKVDNWKKISLVYFSFGEVYKKLGNTEKQKFYLDKCLQLAEAREFKKIAMDAYRLLAEFYQEKHNYKKALLYFTKIQQIKDVLSNENRTRAVEEIKTKMEVERTEREKQVLLQKNDELEIMNREIRKQKDKLEKTEKKLQELNHNLEEKVREEIIRRQKQEQVLIQKSKLESLGQLAAGIAHEINQPLGLINISIQNLFRKVEKEKLSDEYLFEKREFIDQNIDRIKRIIEHIRLFSRDQQNNRNERLDIAETLKNALSMINTQCSNHNINIIQEISTADMATLGNKYRFEQVILNLLSNAKDALEDKFDEYDDNKRIFIRLFLKDKRIFLEIEDNGCGIEKSNLEHVFEPFFTTKSENKGTGLGLSICYGIIQDMDGKISIESSINQFTLLRVELKNIS